MVSQFKGTLNSRTHKKQSYFGNQEDVRFRKFLRIDSLKAHKDIHVRIYRGRYERYTMSYNANKFPFRIGQKEVYRNQREWNNGLSKKSIHLFPWR